MTLSGSSWTDALGHLESQFGTGYAFATITSAAEQDFIESLLANYSGEYWVGGFQDPGQADPAANWNWMTGVEDWNYANWANGEPNDFYGQDSEEYLAVWSQYNWQWNDEWNVNNITGYIAESLPVPEPEPVTIVLMGLGLVGLAGVGRKKFRK